MDSEILTITPVGGQPITVTAPANSAETPAEFAGRIGSACPIHLADLPIVEWGDMEGLVPNIVARFGDCLLVCYDGGGSMVMPECMAVDIDGVGWAIIGPPPAEWGGLDIDTAAHEPIGEMAPVGHPRAAYGAGVASGGVVGGASIPPRAHHASAASASGLTRTAP